MKKNQILKTIIVEDEKTSREILKNYLAKYCPNVQLIGEAENIDQALVLIRNNNLDLVFLDVEMPYGTGFDLLEKLTDIPFEVVFVTAYDQYAIEALNKQAAYYLLKPISIDELIKAVDHVTATIAKEAELQQSVTALQIPVSEEKITIPTQSGFEVLSIKEILYGKADDNYTELYLTNNKKKLVSKTLKYFEKLLVDKGFARIHKSYLVNVSYIAKYKKGKGGSITLSNGKELSVSASKKSNFLSHFK
ncbi:MAG: DNA-binding response regulator [Flavobacteriales bacterium]|nr:MAG: DNA-binding response regulator [Flavobacteriales bacterium]